MRIALLPLDDRPCTFDQVASLARVAGIELALPPRDLVASHRPGGQDYPGLLQWLESELPRADAAVISCEMLFYGGLMHSRSADVSPEQAHGRLAALERAIARNPRCRYYLSSVLLRLSVTVDERHDEGTWKAVFEYLVQADGGEPAELETIRRRIPPGVLEEFLAARERNHSINLGLLGLARSVDLVAFGQEDCAERGLHRPEKARLLARLAELPPELRARFAVMTGADELGALLLMRAYMDHHGVQPGRLRLDVVASDPAGLGRVSKYEDIPVRENIDLHFRLSPFRLEYLPPSRHSELGPGAGPRLVIQTFGPGPQADLCFQEQPARDEAAAELAERLRPGDALLDLTLANGASRALLEAALARRSWRELGSFSAWNTSGNRIGTLVAHLGLQAAASAHGDLDARADRAHLFERLLDDFAYQGIVRARLQAEALAEGANPWALGPRREHYSRRCDELLHREAERLALELPFRAELPWPRLFEARVTLSPA